MGAYCHRVQGFAMLITKAPGACVLMLVATSRMILRLISSRSSRLMPGLRGTPAVMMITSEPATSFSRGAGTRES